MYLIGFDLSINMFIDIGTVISISKILSSDLSNLKVIDHIGLILTIFLT